MADRRRDKELNWSTVLDSDDVMYLMQFVQYGVNLFLERLAVSSLIVSKEASLNQASVYENFQKISSNIVKPNISMFVSEILVPVDTGLTLIAYAA